MARLNTQALLCAGLFLFTAPAMAAAPADLEEAPVRRPIEALAPTPAPTPTPLVSLEDFKRLEQSVSRLSSESSALAKKAEEAASTVRQDLRKDLGGLDEQVQKLLKWQSEQMPSLEKQGKEIQTLAQTFAEARKNLDDGLKKVEDVRQSIERKGQMMEGLLDLLSTLKRDVNDNSREIAGLKQELAKLNDSVSPKDGGAEWWERLARWRYLPLTATALSGLALGMALSR